MSSMVHFSAQIFLVFQTMLSNAGFVSTKAAQSELLRFPRFYHTHFEFTIGRVSPLRINFPPKIKTSFINCLCNKRQWNQSCLSEHWNAEGDGRNPSLGSLMLLKTWHQQSIEICVIMSLYLLASPGGRYDLSAHKSAIMKQSQMQPAKVTVSRCVCVFSFSLFLCLLCKCILGYECQKRTCWELNNKQSTRSSTYLDTCPKTGERSGRTKASMFVGNKSWNCLTNKLTLKAKHCTTNKCRPHNPLGAERLSGARASFQHPHAIEGWIRRERPFYRKRSAEWKPADGLITSLFLASWWQRCQRRRERSGTQRSAGLEGKLGVKSSPEMDPISQLLVLQRGFEAVVMQNETLRSWATHNYPPQSQIKIYKMLINAQFPV